MTYGINKKEDPGSNFFWGNEWVLINPIIESSNPPGKLPWPFWIAEWLAWTCLNRLVTVWHSNYVAKRSWVMLKKKHMEHHCDPRMYLQCGTISKLHILCAWLPYEQVNNLSKINRCSRNKRIYLDRTMLKRASSTSLRKLKGQFEINQHHYIKSKVVVAGFFQSNSQTTPLSAAIVFLEVAWINSEKWHTGHKYKVV